MIFVGTCNEEVGSVLVQRLMESSDLELESPMARLVSLGLGLLFIGKNEKSDAMMEVSAFFTVSFVFYYCYMKATSFYSEDYRQIETKLWQGLTTKDERYSYSVLCLLIGVSIDRSFSYITAYKVVR